MFFRMVLGATCVLITTSLAQADITWGVNGHPIASYPGFPIYRQLDFVRDLGMKSYRIDISSEESVDTLSSLVEEGKKRGITILPVMTPGDTNLEKDTAEQLYSKARKLAVALGSRFKEEIRVWELGNEMENYAIIKRCEMRDDGTRYPCQWGDAGGVSPLDYFGPRWAKVSAVLKGLSDGITEVDPKIRKAMGTAGWGHIGAFERMRNDDIKWDISVWHMYGEDPEWAFKQLVSYGKPIWVTEFNNPYGSQRSEQRQAEGLSQQIGRLRNLQVRYNIEAAYVYELLDETYWAPDVEAFMGLVRFNKGQNGSWIVGEPKPAYLAARDMIHGPRAPLSFERDCNPDLQHSEDPISMRRTKLVFCLLLGHEGSSEDIQEWTSSLQNGEATVSSMVHAVMRSDEFTQRYRTFSMTDREFVSFLYRLFVGREPDSAGLVSYVDQLRAGTLERWAVVEGIISSSEFEARYSASLKGAPDGSVPG
jgi:hypothetical protein